MRILMRAALAGAFALVSTQTIRAQDVDESWVKQQVNVIRQSDTSSWERIPWVGSLLEARRLSGKENQPVFLFTLDGNLETGRC
jgi:hypothetical protein